MTAQWISGEPVPPVPLQVQAAPFSRWQIGRYTLQRYSRKQVPQARGRWGMSNGCVGVANCRTPLGALFALRRWIRESAKLAPHE